MSFIPSVLSNVNNNNNNNNTNNIPIIKYGNPTISSNLYSNLLSIAKYLKNHKVDSVADLVKLITNVEPRKVPDIDFSKVFVPTDHLKDGTHTFKHLARALSSCKIEDATIQLILVQNTSNQTVQAISDGVNNCEMNIVLVCSQSWRDVEAIYKQVKTLKQTVANYIRFDYINPDIKDLRKIDHTIDHITTIIMGKIKEGIIALQYMAYEDNTRAMSDQQFKEFTTKLQSIL